MEKAKARAKGKEKAFPRRPGFRQKWNAILPPDGALQKRLLDKRKRQTQEKGAGVEGIKCTGRKEMVSAESGNLKTFPSWRHLNLNLIPRWDEKTVASVDDTSATASAISICFTQGLLVS